MDKRFFLFLFLASLALFANAMLMNWLNPPPPPKAKAPPVAAKPDQPQIAAAENAQPEQAQPEQPKIEAPAEAPEANQDPQAEIPQQWLTLGSADPDEKNSYRMLVSLTNAGAAVDRIELASPGLRDLEEETGYLGHLALTPSEVQGMLVNMVGPGTPADLAGLRPGDVLLSINDVPLKDTADFLVAMRPTEPGHSVRLSAQRVGKPLSLTATLTRHPIEVVQPEGTDPRSLLLTLAELDNRSISKDLGATTGPSESGAGAQVTKVAPDSPAEKAGLRVGDIIVQVDELEIDGPTDYLELINRLPTGMRLVYTVVREGQSIKLPLRMPAEIAGLDLRTGNWQVHSADQNQVTFAWEVPDTGLEILKQFRLAKAQPGDAEPNYHLTINLKIANRGQQPHSVAYQLDGATGLPNEGWWYASKISRTWSGTGVRDVAVRFQGNDISVVSAMGLAGDDAPWSFAKQTPLEFIGIDAQYFAAILIPKQDSPKDDWFQAVHPLRVGPVPEDKHRRKLVDTSFRVVSQNVLLAPDAPPLEHEFVLFAGPKRRELLAHYGLSDLIYYGWPIWAVFAGLMVEILHFFYSLVGNYGLAIIMLTVLVRGLMFPLSRKQAISAQKMQELQPEIKKLAEKYKNNLEQRNRAQQELFRKHNYNPLGGCLLMFVQLPIFLGLYRGLMTDVELRQAPLIPGIDWASNLAAPDMLFRWDSWMPGFFSDYTGWLGPYFNILPIITVGLFLWQQKMFMPPPADEQAAMQQKMMKYMMVLMGVLFFKVASGLCVYFIASSLWGIAERKLLPKVTPKPGGGGAAEKKTALATAVSSNGNTGGSARKKQRRS